jgi:hypothetical protein
MTRIQLIRCTKLDSVASSQSSFSFSTPGRATGVKSETSDYQSNHMVIGKGCTSMLRHLAVLLLGSMAILVFSQILAAQAAPAAPQAAPGQAETQQVPVKPEDPSSDSPPLPPLPAAPSGKSTIMGGEIRRVDPVRDVLTLKVFGQRPIKILFDERTQVYRDGKKIPLHDLHPADHASVQTLLDGTDVFAVSIHILSQSPEGDYQGRVLSYSATTTEMTVSSALSHQPLKLLVPAGTPVVREGQPAFTAGQQGMSDLVPGDLVTVKFEANKAGQGVASRIAILAMPGSEFVFIGNVSVLDTHAGVLVLVDPRDDKTYEVHFDSGSFPISKNLHLGDHITVTAKFDGTRYMASAIAAN